MTWKNLHSEIIGDLPKEKKNFQGFLYNYFFSLSFRLLLNYRLGKYFHFSRWKILKLLGIRYKIIQLQRRNCEISYKSTIGKNVKFAHPLGVVVGSGVVIEDGVTIWQQVTLGSHGRDEEKNYPIIGKHAKIHAGAKIIGGVNVGEYSIIGANAVVLTDVPNNGIAVGVPARIIQK